MAPEAALGRHQQSVVAPVDLLAPVTHAPRGESAISPSPLSPLPGQQLFLCQP